VYWEEQERGLALCAVHCLNNLLQGQYFTEADLADIAAELTREERLLRRGASAPEDEANAAEDGFFSVEVIHRALEPFGLLMVSINSEEAKEEASDPLRCQGFVCNLREHWFAIRRLDGVFYNLNSLNKKGPERISDFYLTALLDQLRLEAYSIFVVRGGFPRPNRQLTGPRGAWYPKAAIAARDEGKASAEDVELARALELSLQDARGAPSGAPPPPSQQRSPALDDEDAQLAAAIRESLKGQHHPARR
jgi:ataxin-3